MHPMHCSNEVVLTDLGELLLDRAKEILKLVEDTFSLLSDAGRNGRIRLGAIPTIAPYFLPEILRGFSGLHPNISVIVLEDTTETLVRRCSHGEIDVVILALPLIEKHLEVEPLFDEELFLVVPSGHPLAAKEEVSVGDVEPHPFIMLNEAHCLSDHVSSYCRRQLVQPVAVERISQIATVQELVALGHGISILPEMARRLDGDGRRVYRSLAGETPIRTIAMAWNPYRYRSKWQSALVDHLRSVASDRKRRAGRGRKLPG